MARRAYGARARAQEGGRRPDTGFVRDPALYLSAAGVVVLPYPERLAASGSTATRPPMASLSFWRSPGSTAMSSSAG